MTLFDFEKISRKMTDKVFDYFELFTDGKYPKKFKKFIEWYGYKFQPVFLNISSMVLMFWIFFRVYGRVGFEKTIIILMLLIIISLRNLKPK